MKSKFSWRSIALAAVFLTFGLFGCQSSLPKNPPPTVDRVDLSRYIGLWYELARLPVFYQNDDALATAEYSLIEAGEAVALVNTSIEPDGKSQSVTGRAVPVEESNGAQLKVSIDNFFARLFGSPPAYGNYWILRLDEDYRLALVGAPDREALWLLSREPEIPQAILQEWLAYANEIGYSTEEIIVNNGAFPQ